MLCVKMAAKKNSHVTKTGKTIIPKEFFNKI